MVDALTDASQVETDRPKVTNLFQPKGGEKYRRRSIDFLTHPATIALLMGIFYLSYKYHPSVVARNTVSTPYTVAALPGQIFSTPTAETLTSWRAHQGEFYQLETPLSWNKIYQNVFYLDNIGFNIWREPTNRLSLDQMVLQKAARSSDPFTIRETTLSGQRALELQYQTTLSRRGLGTIDEYGRIISIPNGLDNITITATQIGDKFYHVLFYEDSQEAEKNRPLVQKIISSISFH